MPKGKYYGPDKYKGKIPEGYKGDAKGKYFGPEKYKGKVQKEGSTSKLKADAGELTDKQYAGVLKEIDDSRANNRSNYEDWLAKRQESLKNELASNVTAGSIVQNVLLGLKSKAMASYDAQQQAREATQAVVRENTQANNQQALLNFEQEMQSRGIQKGEQRNQMEAAFNKQLSFSDELNNIRNELEKTTQTNREEMSNAYVGQAANAQTTAQTGAQARASEEMNEQYSAYNERRQTLDTAAAKAKLDKESSYLNTFLTLKREAEQRKAEAAQAKLEAAVAMGKQSSSDYFREADLQLDTQKFLHGVQMDEKNLTLNTRKQDAKEKMGGLKPPPKPKKYTFTSPSAPAYAQRMYWS